MRSGKAICRAAALLVLHFACSPAAASGVGLDLLIDRLAERGIISGGEAREMKAGGTSGTVPRGIRFGGDLRLRYQFTDNANRAAARRLSRYRLRVSGDSEINGRVRAGFRFASGGSADPRSTNQTLTGNNAKKNLYIDRAFAEYRPSENLSVTAGRAANPLWRTSGILWDGDINLEGVSAKADWSGGPGLRFSAVAGIAVLGDSSSPPRLVYAQQTAAWESRDGSFLLKAAAALYLFDNVRGSAALPYRPSAADYPQGNTFVSSVYRYDYDAFAPELEFSRLLRGPGPDGRRGEIRAGLFLSGVKALGHSGGGSGWIAGIKAGYPETGDAGGWQARYSYRRLGRDAWPDTYPDSDFYGGSSNAEGHEAGLTVGLMRGVAAGLCGALSGPVEGGYGKERSFRADISLSF